MKIKAIDLRDLRVEDDESLGDWTFISDEIVDTWRWGDIQVIVLLHSSGTFWAYRYSTERSNDEFRVLIPEGDEELELYEVEPSTKVIYVRKEK